ncbi:hypothetical protein JHW45_04835 [Paracoccus stylophorae]|uniref:Group 4 capsule polysaccharide lipoprotein gfcB, YjbF n=1 Tax=Paracoccus stylophorae TaxID=659350 RepID=A0ABY7SXY9_9RHOB|nr:hypothetical protein [Paracoccus stylophorae]WCR11704.1 hypothetical protein JHW45_04835 [Paracoccus stylophorae]
MPRRRRGEAAAWSAALSLIAAVAHSGPDPTDAEAAVLPRILDAVPVEIAAGHLGQERAILLLNDDPDAMTADLVILAGDPDDRAGQAIAISRGLVWAGRMAGQVPWLDVAANGSLLVGSQQTGIGRSPWEQTLILAERDGAVRVAGFRLVQWDRITASSASCDWNLLTGEWQLEAQIQSENGDPRTVTKQGRRPERIAVQDWPAQGEDPAQMCRIDLTAP